MAYYVDDENENQDGTGPQSTGPEGSSVIGAQAAPQGGNAGNPSVDKTPDRGSNFVGIRDYLNANKAQAGALGDQASGVIQNSANAARGSVQGLQDRFNQQAGSAVQNNQELLGKLDRPERLSNEEKQAIKNQYNAQYTGPNSLQDYGQDYTNAIKQAQIAKANVENAGTEQGRQQIISQINDKPRNTGITTFDSLLLQAGGGREKLDQAAKANKDVSQDLLGAANISAQQKASDIKSQTDATRTATQGAVTGATTNFQKELEKKVKDWQQKMVGANNALSQDVTDLELSPETLAAYGLDDGQSTYGLDLGSYIQDPGLDAVNAANVANNNDYDRYLALMDLAGQNPELLNASGKRIINGETGEISGVAGTAPKVSVDINKFLADRAAKEKAYNEAWNKVGGLDLSNLPDNQTGRWVRDQVSKLSPSQVGAWLENYKNATAGDNQGVAKWFADAVQSQLDKMQSDYRVNQTVKRAQ